MQINANLIEVQNNKLRTSNTYDCAEVFHDLKKKKIKQKSPEIQGRLAEKQCTHPVQMAQLSEQVSVTAI